MRIAKDINKEKGYTRKVQIEKKKQHIRLVVSGHIRNSKLVQ